MQHDHIAVAGVTADAAVEVVDRVTSPFEHLHEDFVAVAQQAGHTEGRVGLAR